MKPTETVYLNVEGVKAVFEKYHIPFEVPRNNTLESADYAGEGRIKVVPRRDSDLDVLCHVTDVFRSIGLDFICDHIHVFRDENDNRVFMYCPFYTPPMKADETLSYDGALREIAYRCSRDCELYEGAAYVDGYKIEVSDRTIWHPFSTTFVVRKA